ncbi:glycosyltransferase family 4 protein [Aliarcobacter cryaerophilus]|uniref:glycosyltransferase family 4 protein n=1 Tax=Aliarcobacter cryaerophilus TaxID=28198 RepID=UPI003DA63261
MKKIGILAFGDKHGGGVYQYTQSIIDALKEDKTKKYIIFCSSDDDRFDEYGLEVRKIDKPKSTLFAKIIRAFQFLLFVQKPLFFTKEELDKFSDIDMFLSPAISAYPHFYMNKPFVFTLHDMQERYYPEFFSKYERLMRWLNNRTLARSADKVICESNFVKNDIIKFTEVNGDKISVIQSPPPENFLNYRFDSENFGAVKAKYNLPEKFVFYPAQCWFHKNHIKLVEAFEIVTKKYDDVYLILTGSQQNNYNNLMARIDELNLNDKVKHLGYIDYGDLPYFYKMSQFLVMPTLFESVSIPIYEAFGLEVAVCSSDVVALPEQVGDAGVIFDPHNINDMADKMMMYLNDEKLQKEKARLGFERVENFNHNEYKNKLMELLKI